MSNIWKESSKASEKFLILHISLIRVFGEVINVALEKIVVYVVLEIGVSFSGYFCLCHDGWRQPGPGNDFYQHI